MHKSKHSKNNSFLWQLGEWLWLCIDVTVLFLYLVYLESSPHSLCVFIKDLCKHVKYEKPKEQTSTISLFPLSLCVCVCVASFLCVWACLCGFYFFWLLLSFFFPSCFLLYSHVCMFTVLSLYLHFMLTFFLPFLSLLSMCVSTHTTHTPT